MSTTIKRKPAGRKPSKKDATERKIAGRGVIAFRHPVYATVLRAMARRASRDREHARKNLQDKEWIRQASDYSVEAARRNTTVPFRELIIDHYNYFYYRAHAKHGTESIDPHAVKVWFHLTNEQL